MNRIGKIFFIIVVILCLLVFIAIAVLNRSSTKFVYGDYYDSVEESIRSALVNSESTVFIFPECFTLSKEAVFHKLDKVHMNEPTSLYFESAGYFAGLLKLNYELSKTEIRLKREAMLSKAKAISESITKKGMSDYDRVLAAHDYLINHCEYDVRYLEKIRSKDPDMNDSHMAFGALMNNRAVCDGYAKALKLLLDLQSIESYVVYGTSRGENHAWLLVKLGNYYYHIDPTWNDPVSNISASTGNHHYFCLSDEMMSVTHRWKREEYPAALNDSLYYYTLNELEFHDLDTLMKEISKTVRKGKTDFEARVLIPNIGESALSDVIRKSFVSVDSFRVQEVSFSWNKDFSILNIYFKYD